MPDTLIYPVTPSTLATPSPALDAPPNSTPTPENLIGADTPPALALLLGAAAAGFNPSTPRDEYTKRRAQWEEYLKLFELEPTELAEMVLPHSENENKDRLKLRKQLTAVYNLIPIIVRMTVSYLYTEDPQIDPGDDEEMRAFVANCDGAGRTLAQYVKEVVLPMAQVLGWVDCLVQNPLVSSDMVRTTQDKTDAGVCPQLYAILPQRRINWSSRPNHAYNWVCFMEEGNEDANPLRRNAIPLTSYITLSAPVPEADEKHGFWIRSWEPARTVGTGTPAAPPAPIASGTKAGGAGFYHEADFFPTARVPVAPFYWQLSNDPKKRHYGLSKVAMISVLTKQIIQILSWTSEDVLASLALLAIPTKGGRVPKNDEGTAWLGDLSAFSFITYDSESKQGPAYIQGDTKHIEIKLKLIDAHVREILRLANLLGASAEAEKISSGVQGVVMRNELFRELKDAAGQCDRFTREVLALAKSWITDTDISADDMEDEVTVRFFKGPYATEPVTSVIEAASATIDLLRDVSPTAAKVGFQQVARAMIPPDSPDLKDALKEIEDNTEGVLEAQSFKADVAAGVKQSPAQKALAEAQQAETTLKNDLGTQKRDYIANAE